MAADVDALIEQMNGTRPVLEQIANKWSVLILAVLCERPSRFNAIKRRLDPITHKALAEALRRLERNGLANRHVISLKPVAVEYSITPLGRTLQEPFTALLEWARVHGPALARAQAQADALANVSADGLGEPADAAARIAAGG